MNVKVGFGCAGLVALVLLAGCEDRHGADRAQSASSPPLGSADRAASRANAPSEGGAMGGGGHFRRASTPQFHGKPLWADNRRGTAEENAQYQFEHRGGDIDAKSLEDYLTKVHNFFDHPPKDAETVERASNGDLLIYSASANLFGVQRKDGAPRLLMKPPEGRSYWEAQKTRAGQPRRSSEAEAR